MMKISGGIVFFWLVLSVAVSTAAPAQEGADTGALQEIVVTAQKRSEDLQAVPIAVSAIGSEQLAETGVYDAGGLAAALPGLEILNIAGRISPRIRGVGSAATGAGIESPVGTYVDGVYLAYAADVDMDLFDVTQVAAIKGPQGTLFGRNATGGVLQITTRNPEHDFGGSFRLGLDDYLTTRGDAFLTGGLSDTVAASIAMTYAHQGDGWGKDLTTDEDIYQINHSYSIRGKVKVDLSDKTDILLSADYANRATSMSQNFKAEAGLSSVFYVPQPKSPWDTVSSSDPYDHYSGGGASVTVNQDLDFAKLTSITAYRSSTASYYFTAAPVPTPVLDLFIPERSKELTQEFQLSNTSGPLIWTVGAFYFYNKANVDQQDFFKPAFSQALGFPFPFISETLPSELTARSPAAYAQATYSVTPSTRITAGIRYTWQTTDFTASDIGILAGNIPTTLFQTAPGEKTSFKKPTWRLSVDQDLTQDVIGYASYNRGVKSGGYNTGDPENPPFAPEQLDAYEVGVKSLLHDRKVRLNAASFYYKYKNIQVPVYHLTSEITNGAAAEIYGVDVDLEARATEQLSFNAGVTWLHPVFTNFPNAAANMLLPSGIPGPTFDRSASGHDIPYSPRLTSVVGATYTIPSSSGDFALNVNDSYNSGYYAEADNFLHQSAFSYLNASISWTSTNTKKPVVVRIYANNLLDKAQSQFATLAGLTYINNDIGPPRVVGGSIQCNF
jgi:iron complex outermembrane recepter protein